LILDKIANILSFYEIRVFLSQRCFYFFKIALSLVMKMEKTYFSKLLLFGEHTVNLGSQALAMPLTQFSGQWNYGKAQYDLAQFATYLDGLRQNNNAILEIDTLALKAEIEKGLSFDSAVPKGYGAGSSGVLCAAIYDTFGVNKKATTFFNLPTLKNGFALMESYFHGKSSGVDPLICYLNEPLLITSQGITTVSLPMYLSPGNAVFLLDTGITRKAEPLIEWFMQSSQNADFQLNIKENLVSYNNAAIAAFLEGHWTNLLKATHQISDFQFQFLQPLIPSAFHDLWQQSLQHDDFKLKICGAGGGGFILGVTKNFAKAKEILKEYDVFQVFP
jgi:mevalonate kinase